MEDLLLNIEQACLQLNGSTLVIPGILGIVLGLFLWIGGMRYAQLVLGLLGAVAGGFAGLAVSQWFEQGNTLWYILGGAVILALVAILIRRMVILLLATLIFAIVAGTAYFGYSITTEQYQDLLGRVRQTADNIRQNRQSLQDAQADDNEMILARRLAELMQQQQDAQEQTSNHDQAMGKLRALWEELRYAASANKGMLIACVIAGAALGLALAFLLRHLVMALCCSIVGTSAIMAGLAAILLATGKTILTQMNQKPTVAPAIFIIMVALGWGIQLLITPALKAKKSTDDSDEEEQE